MNTIRVSNCLGQDQARHFVGPYLGPNCLQRFSTDDTSRQRVHASDFNYQQQQKNKQRKAISKPYNKTL